jgi:hypothetical protein
VLGRLVLAAVAALVLVSTASGSGAPRTGIVVNVTPFTGDGHLRGGLRIAREARGTCEPGSDSLPNNVYRCFFGNTIVDPCWRDWRSSAPSVVCLEEPWAGTVIRLRLTAPPPRSRGHSDLTGREGAPVIDYYCGKTVALVRGVNRTHTDWTIRAARITHQLSHPYALIGWVPIKTAWFGGNNPLSSRP